MGGGLERVRSISLAPKQTLRPLLPPASHNFAPSLPMTSLENAPLPRPGSLALGLTPALCSPCRPRSTLLVREFVTVTVTAGSIKIAKAHPGLAFSPRVQCNQLCFERGRPLQGRPRVLARVVPTAEPRRATSIDSRAGGGTAASLCRACTALGCALASTAGCRLLNPTFCAFV